MTFEQAIRILTLKPDFTTEQLKKSYRTQAVKHHPDKGGSEKKFTIVNNAYELLCKSGPRVVTQRQETRQESYGGTSSVGGSSYWTRTSTITVEEVRFHTGRMVNRSRIR